MQLDYRSTNATAILSLPEPCPRPSNSIRVAVLVSEKVAKARWSLFRSRSVKLFPSS